MKAVVAEELCGPSGLVYRDIDDIPDEVDGAVVIDVRAAGVTFPDLLVIRGEYQMKATPPFVPGYAAGRIPTVKVNRLLMRNVGVLGVGWGEYFLTHPGAEQLFGFGVSRLVQAGLRPPPPVRYPLSKARDALQLLADGGVFGKLVLEP